MECDNFTNRGGSVKDSLARFDKFTSVLLQKALLQTNTEFKLPCDRRALFDNIESEFSGVLGSKLETWLNRNPMIEKLAADPNAPGSLYDGLPLLNYPLTHVSGIDPSIKIAGHIVGTDKFGHFMTEGYETYKRIVLKDGSLEKAMLWGIGTEQGYFGLSVSGVKSYSDLAANYGGSRFWASILDGPSPYFACIDGKFAQIRRFTWADHVNNAWDEGINCSQFNPSAAGIVFANLSKMRMTCPVMGSETTCAGLMKLPDARWYVSPICQKLASANKAKQLEPGDYIISGRAGH